MPRIINATFTPFTYDELAAPLREATAAHQAQEQKYDELMSDADKMRAFLNEDWQSYKDYEDYVNRLNAAAEELARNGLSRQTQRQLLGLRRDYNGKIQAINAGILSRQNAIENFNKSAKGQSSRYIGSRPEDYSVDEYMYGNNPFKIGVDGSEINKYAEDSAKAIADRRYNEFTKDGYRISEIGIDPLTTQIVLDKLKNGGRYITEDEAKMYNLDNRQLSYMNAVIGDLSNAVNDTMTSFGYDSFTDFDFNGNPVKSNKQRMFESEMFNGLNKGISYKRTSQADPYELANHKEQLERETAAQKAGSTGTASSGFGLTPIDFTSGDAIKATKNLDLKQDKEGFFETPQLDIEYKGEKLHFNSKLDAYRWSYDGESIAKLKNQLDDVNEQLSKTRKLTADLGFGERMSLEKEKAHLEYQIRKLDMVHERRSKVLKKHGYYMSDSEYRDVAKAYGFDEDDFNFSIDDIYEATNGSMTNVVSGRVNAIHVAPPSGTSAGADDKVTYTDDKITKKIKGRVSNGLVANNPGKESLNLYEISPNGLKATGLKRKNNKTKDLKKIIERATSIYTTIELLTGFDGTNAQNYDPKSAIPIIVFQDPEGRRVGVPIDYLGYEYRGVFNKALGYIANSGGVLTNRNRGQIERYIAKDMADVSNMIYGKD